MAKRSNPYQQEVVIPAKKRKIYISNMRAAPNSVVTTVCFIFPYQHMIRKNIYLSLQRHREIVDVTGDSSSEDDDVSDESDDQGINNAEQGYKRMPRERLQHKESETGMEIQEIWKSKRQREQQEARHRALREERRKQDKIMAQIDAEIKGKEETKRNILQQGKLRMEQEKREKQKIIIEQQKKKAFNSIASLLEHRDVFAILSFLIVGILVYFSFPEFFSGIFLAIWDMLSWVWSFNILRGIFTICLILGGFLMMAIQPEKKHPRETRK